MQRVGTTLLGDGASGFQRSLRCNTTTALRTTSVRTFTTPSAPWLQSQRLPQSPSRADSPRTAGYLAGQAAVWSTIISSGRSGKIRPSNPAPSKATPEEIWKIRHESFMATQPRIGDAYSGRSIPVIKGDVNTAYSKLNTRLKQNRVRYELRMQERHEKKGDKRRRLRSERWRRRFAHEVRKKVQLVEAIRRRGA